MRLKSIDSGHKFQLVDTSNALCILLTAQLQIEVSTLREFCLIVSDFLLKTDSLLILGGMATGGGHRKISFMPTTPPGPSAAPIFLCAPSASAGLGKH